MTLLNNRASRGFSATTEFLYMYTIGLPKLELLNINFLRIRYFYCCFVDLSEHSPCMCNETLFSCRFLYYEEASVTDENVMFVMYAARKYRVSPLIELCERHVDTAMSVDRVLGMLRQSLTFADEALLDRCLSFVRSNTSDVLAGRQFVDVSEDILAMIVDQPQLSVIEVDLFRACVDWATRQLRHDVPTATVDGTSLRQTLGNILPRIRFPTMSLDQFSSAVVPLGVLTTDETCQLYKYLTCPEKPETGFNAVFRCVNVSTLLTLSSNYKLKKVSPRPRMYKCYGNVNKPIRLHELRFISHEVTASTKAVVHVNAVKLEQDGRAIELAFGSESRNAEAVVQEDCCTKPRVLRPTAVPFRKHANVGISPKKLPRPIFPKFSPAVFAAVGANDEVGRPDYSDEPILETKRVNVKSDVWTWSTLTTPGDGKVYKVIHVRWDGEDLLLDEGDFTLSYGFNVITSAASDVAGDFELDAFTADTCLADTKVLVAPALSLFTSLDSEPTNQLLYIRRLDHKLFESNDVAFTMNFPSGPLVAFAFYRL